MNVKKYKKGFTWLCLKHSSLFPAAHLFSSQNYPTNKIDIIVMIRIVPEQHGGLDREKHNPPPRPNHPCLPSMRGSRHLEMRKMTLVRVTLTMVIVTMVTLVKTSGTYRKPPSRSSF